jgi:hypothetical protein
MGPWVEGGRGLSEGVCWAEGERRRSGPRERGGRGEFGPRERKRVFLFLPRLFERDSKEIERNFAMG